MGKHAHNTSTWKAEAAGGSCAPSQSGLHSWTLSKKMLVFSYFNFFIFHGNKLPTEKKLSPNTAAPIGKDNELLETFNFDFS